MAPAWQWPSPRRGRRCNWSSRRRARPHGCASPQVRCCPSPAWGPRSSGCRPGAAPAGASDGEVPIVEPAGDAPRPPPMAPTSPALFLPQPPTGGGSGRLTTERDGARRGLPVVPSPPDGSAHRAQDPHDDADDDQDDPDRVQDRWDVEEGNEQDEDDAKDDHRRSDHGMRATTGRPHPSPSANGHTCRQGGSPTPIAWSTLPSG